MEEIVLNPNEQIRLESGESLSGSDAGALLIRYGEGAVPALPGTNIFANAEWTIWNTIKNVSGNQTAVYKKQNSNIETTVFVVPETPQPDGFAFEDFKLYKTSRVFKVGKLELNGMIPKEGDTLTYIYNEAETMYTVKKTQAGPCYEDIGNYNVMLRLYCSVYRH